jgi:hypothetical protein
MMTDSAKKPKIGVYHKQKNSLASQQMTSTSKGSIKNVIDLTQHQKPPASAANKPMLSVQKILNAQKLATTGGKNTMMTTA